jgi:hypothetical protein
MKTHIYDLHSTTKLKMKEPNKTNISKLDKYMKVSSYILLQCFV